jgi:uncharacterized Tic20 family protein
MPFEDVPPSRPAPERPTDVTAAEPFPDGTADSLPAEPRDLGTPMALTAEDRQWGMVAHLSALLGLLAGFMTFLGPLIVWLVKKDESKFVDYHGKESLNFQLNILIYTLILVAATVVTCGFGVFVTVPLFGALAVYAIVMPIIAGLKANEGKLYEYPLTFRMIK